MANCGIARLVVERQHGRSVIVDQYSQAPLLLSKPLYLEGADFPTIFLRSPSSGLLANDVHEVDVRIGVDAQLELRTQGATLIYPGTSRLKTKLDLSDGANLKYLPHPLILARGAQFDQSIEVRLGEQSGLLFKESWVCGRVAMGEQWEFQRFDNLIEIFEGDEISYRECWSIEPDRDQVSNPIICGAYKHFETVFDFGGQSKLQSRSPAASDQPGIRWSMSRGRATILREAVQL